LAIACRDWATGFRLARASREEAQERCRNRTADGRPPRKPATVLCENP
jgi:hypothetical protein